MTYLKVKNFLETYHIKNQQQKKVTYDLRILTLSEGDKSEKKKNCKG